MAAFYIFINKCFYFRHHSVLYYTFILWFYIKDANFKRLSLFSCYNLLQWLHWSDRSLLLLFFFCSFPLLVIHFLLVIYLSSLWMLHWPWIISDVTRSDLFYPADRGFASSVSLWVHISLSICVYAGSLDNNCNAIWLWTLWYVDRHTHTHTCTIL